MDHTTKEFFIEATDSTPLKAFTKSTVLNFLNTAEKEGAEKCYICVRLDCKDHGKKNTILATSILKIPFPCLASFLRTFSLIGFRILTEQEQENVSMTCTHTLMEYNLKDEGNMEDL